MAATAPDGGITYCTSNQACFAARAQTTDAEPLLQSLWPMRDLVQSPDGRRVAFAKLRTDLVDSGNIWVSDAAGREPRTFTRDSGLQYQPAWSPDGTQIAFVAGDGPGTYEIYVMAVDAARIRRLTANDSLEFLPAWSPNGRRIAFTSDRTGDYEIWVMQADGSDPRQLTHAPGLDTRPAWSPDGRHIAFTTNRSGHMEIWVMRADGTEPRVLEQAEGGVCDPAWR